MSALRRWLQSVFGDRRLSPLAKSGWSTVVVVGAGIGWLVGILDGLPGAIVNVAQHGPAILQNPNTWWTVAMLVFVGISLRWIWKIPADEDGWSERLDEAAQISDRCYNLACFEMTVVKSHRQLRKNNYCADENMAIGWIEAIFAQRIEFLIGSEEREKFILAVRDAKRKSKGSIAVIFSAATSYIEHLVDQEIKKEIAAKGKATIQPGTSQSTPKSHP